MENYSINKNFLDESSVLYTLVTIHLFIEIMCTNYNSKYFYFSAILLNTLMMMVESSIVLNLGVSRNPDNVFLYLHPFTE